jgi:hypothetical protein
MGHVLGFQEFIKFFFRQPVFGDDAVINAAAGFRRLFRDGGGIEVADLVPGEPL